jgi:hypothetical protein
MPDSGIFKREKGFGPLVRTRIDVDAQRVETHPQHGFKVSSMFLAVVNRYAIQKVRPGQQPSRLEARLGPPRTVGEGQVQIPRGLQRISVSIEAEERSLPLKKIEDRVENRLWSGAADADSGAIALRLLSADFISLGIFERSLVHLQSEDEIFGTRFCP